MVRDSREEWKTRSSVFDQFTNRLLFKLAGQGHFDELRSIVAPGKEAVVFLATRNDGSPVAVKIYRLETANFSKMYSYIRVDPRYQRLQNRQRQVIFAWTEREYRNLLLARQAGVCVPTPIAHKDNILIMEWIGDTLPSPLLRHSPPENVQQFFDQTMLEMRKLARSGMVHGDLSEYNIINHHEEPTLIDFSHSVTLEAPNSRELLERDVKNVCHYFQNYGITVDEKQIFSELFKEWENARDQEK